MRRLAFEGYSEDLLKVDGCGPGEPDEASVSGGEAVFDLSVADSNEGLRVFATFSSCGWALGVALLDDRQPLPDWNLRFQTASHGRSPRLIIEAPDDAVLRLAEPRRADKRPLLPDMAEERCLTGKCDYHCAYRDQPWCRHHSRQHDSSEVGGGAE